MKVEERDGRVYLVCTDNGVGMNKAVIRDYLLVSGRNRRPEFNALERRCKEKNFSVERSGKFGIGVLSYFMIADQLIIRTLHNEGEGAEAVGWRFETDGVGSFGELRPDPQIARGTEVTLRIRRDRQDFVRGIAALHSLQTRALVGKIGQEQAADWYKAGYLDKTLLRVPCKVDLEAPQPPFGPGWAHSAEAVGLELTNAGPLESHLPHCRDRLWGHATCF